MRLSVIILNYNVRYFLELCLKSVQKAINTIDAEIIVVDNASEDDSCLMVKNLFPEVVLIENKTNFGFSKGNNIGISQAKGNYICILNPDTVVAEDTFTAILNFADNTPNLGIVGCKLINGAGTFLPESKRNIPFVSVAFKKLFGNSKQYYANHLKDTDIGKVPVLVGAFMLVKRDILKTVGGFDERYFMYGEDIDLSYNILKLGFDNYYFGATSIIHFKGESTLKDIHYARRFYGAMQLFYKKHFKKNRVYDMFVWLGIRLVYLFRKVPVNKQKRLNSYIFVSDKMNNALEKTLAKKVTLQSNIDTLENATEVIFDANILTNKDIITMMANNKNKSITFKILPHNSPFIIGSDNAISQGEIIVLN